jgi:MFS family permease
VSRLVETVAPARLGTGFRWLLASSWVSNLGDGIALAAGPLVVASLTKSPALVALAATVQWLPPLMFALFAGALTDKLDRRRIVVTVDVVRAVVLTLRIGLVIETSTHLALALTTRAWVALPTFFVFGAHAFIWGTTSITVRQRAVPTELQGRVGSVNLVGSSADS